MLPKGTTGAPEVITELFEKLGLNKTSYQIGKTKVSNSDFFFYYLNLSPLPLFSMFFLLHICLIELKMLYNLFCHKNRNGEALFSLKIKCVTRSLFLPSICSGFSQRKGASVTP